MSVTEGEVEWDEVSESITKKYMAKEATEKVQSFELILKHRIERCFFI